jgi:hypothetical protein
MEKTITIDGKQVRFKSTGATALRYNMQFRKDFFVEIMKLDRLKKIKDIQENPNLLDGIDFEVFFNVAWTMAKTADPEIPDPITWLDSFDEFPLMDIIPELEELIYANIASKKK